MTVLIRNIGAFVDGVVFAILMMNIANPLLDKIRPKAMGEGLNMREMIKLFLSVLIFSGVFRRAARGAQERHPGSDRVPAAQIRQRPCHSSRSCRAAPTIPWWIVSRSPTGKKERNVFVGVFDGKPSTVAFETSGKGYGGDIGVIVAVNLENDQIVGVGVTTHSETPGVGSRAKTDPAFTAQFKGLSMKEPFQVKADGGQIDAVSGATITSRGRLRRGIESGEIYLRLKPQIVEKMKTIKS